MASDDDKNFADGWDWFWFVWLPMIAGCGLVWAGVYKLLGH
jgi:hypothetical protein